MTHIPLCQTKGCPFPSSDEWHRCFVCGKAEGDHQHFPKKSLAGKGAKIVAFLCRNHHQKITLHQWREGVYTHPDQSLRYYVQNAKGEQQCERIIEEAHGILLPPPDEPREADLAAYFEAHKDDPEEWEDEPTPFVVGPPPDGPREALPAVQEPTRLSSLSDEQLATMFQEGDARQAEGFLLKCRVVQAYRERHIQAWGESWLENAYDLFHVSRRTLFAYANIGALVDKADTYLVENIGPLTSSKSLMTHIGRKALPDGKVALEEAVTHLAKFGEPPSVAALEHRLGVESKPSDTCSVAVDGKHVFKCVFCRKAR